MQDFSSALQKIEPTSRLVVLRGEPEKVFEQILKAWSVTHIIYEVDTAGYARERDARVKKVAKRLGVEVVEVQGATLYDVDEIVKVRRVRPVPKLVDCT